VIGAPPTKRVFRQLLVPVVLVGAMLAFAVPSVFDTFLDFDDEQLRYTRIVFVVGFLAIGAFLALGLAVGVRGVAGARPEDASARRRILRLPVRLAATVAIGGGAVILLAMLLRLLTFRDAASQVFGVGISSAALIGFLAVPMYVGARAALLPHALYFARESLPSGRRLSIGLLAGYTILSVAAVALVPAAVFGNARLDAARERAATERALASARRLAKILEGHTPTEALRIVARTHLANAIVLLRMPSGQLLPDDAAIEAAGAVGQEVQLSGDLRGGSVRIVAHIPHRSQTVLLLVVLGIVGLASVIASSLARALSRDARGVTRQVEAVADGTPPPSVGTVATSEVRRVALAVNRLLDRIPRLQLEKYLAIERAEESRRLKSMFLANMSHDLRSPLNSILGFSELLTRGLEGPITPLQRATLDEINSTGNYLLRLLSEILDTARAESGHLDLDRKPTPPATFVAQARKEALRGRPERVADALTLDLQAGVSAIHVDALRMQQALTHVIDWAIDAAQGSAVRIDVADRDRPLGRAFVLEVVCDRATTRKDEALLFQPFRKAPGVPGLHLALPLARRIVEAHGGSIEPYSEGELDLDLELDSAVGSGRALTASASSRRRLGVRIVLPRRPISQPHLETHR